MFRDCFRRVVAVAAESAVIKDALDLSSATVQIMLSLAAVVVVVKWAQFHPCCHLDQTAWTHTNDRVGNSTMLLMYVWNV